MKIYSSNYALLLQRQQATIIRVMKLTTLLMIFFLAQISAKSFSQKITLDQRNITIGKVMEAIKKQTGYNFLYESDVELSVKINVRMKNASLEETLKECFKNQPLVYRIVNKTILISKAPVTEVKVKKEVSSSEQALYLLKGKVTDEKGQPLPAVSIKVKGANRTVATDANGNFEINVNAGDILSISYIGYETQEITIKDQKNINIVLKEAKNELNAVVVTALGIKRQTRSLTYNVQEVSGTEVNTIKSGNFVGDLAGKVAGATINTSSSGIGGSARVVLRGTKAISPGGISKNNALYVIDGVPLNNFNGGGTALGIYDGANTTGDGISQLNPDDIESISVLTGPAAAALYGKDGAAGAIIVTTKKGVAGKTQFSVNNNTSFFSPFVLPKFQNTYGSEAGSFSSWGDKLQTPSTYNPKDFFQTGTFVNNSVSFSTGTEKNQTYVSAGQANGRGIIPNNKLERFNASLRNTTTFFNDKLLLDAGINYINESDQNLITQGLYNNPLVPIYLFPRGDDIEKYQVYERYDVTRNFKTQFWPYGDQGFTMQNPYWIVNRNIFTHKTNRYILNASLKYTVTDWLNVVVRGRRDFAQTIGERKYFASTIGVLAGDNGFYGKNTTTTTQNYADVIATATKTIKDFTGTAIIGASYDRRYNEVFGLEGNLLTLANLFNFNNVNRESSNFKTPQQITQQEAQALFGNFQIGYKNYLFADFSARSDWNSALAGQAKQYIFYPSVGLSSVLTDAFKIQSKTLSYLKVRASYSEVGTPPDPYLGVYNGNTLSYGNVGLSTIFPNNVKPERTKSYELGINSKFLNNVISFDVTLYKSSTFNQIFPVALPPATGYTTVNINGGKIDNKGIEASLNVNTNLGPVKWSSGAIFSLNRNKIITLAEDVFIPIINEKYSKNFFDLNSAAGGYKQQLFTGGSTGDIYVNTLRVDEHGYIVVDPRTRTVFADANNFVKAGNADPRYNIGFNNTFSYKDFSLKVLVTARIGGVGVSMTQAFLDRFGVSQASADARANGGVLINGGLIPAQPYYEVVGGGLTGIAAPYVYSATNVRLGEATLSYLVPGKFFKNKIKGATLSLTGRNLFMFYNKAPFDPESTASVGTYFQGIDYFRQPSLRSLGFNVSVQF